MAVEAVAIQCKEQAYSKRNMRRRRSRRREKEENGRNEVQK